MEQLGRYLLDRKLAAGGMAEVFLAKQVGPNGSEKPCVVKRMLPHLSEDLTFIEMFLDEARLAARLAHPGIAQILDFGHERDTYYLALEYVPGLNLKTVLEQRLVARKPVPLPVAARLTSLVATALDYAHHAVDEKGRPLEIIHRDVSPHNVMVSVNGDVKLIDFGIAKAASDSHRTVAGTLKGKYAYMSPEQLRQQKVDQRTDIYALGLVLYELITGRPAVAPNDNLNALMAAAAQRRYPPLESFRPETPKRLREILDRALALDPADRFQKARQLADALEDWLASGGARVKPSELAELVTDPASIATEPGGHAVPKPVRIEDDVPPTVVPMSEARTVRDLPKPQLLKETVASRKPASAVERVYDSSAAETPIVGTPPVARRKVDVTDVSLVPTEPERVGPDVDAVMAMTRRALAKEPVVPPPAATSVTVPPPTVQPSPTAVMPAPPLEKRARRWPWVLVILLLLPIGAAAAAIEFLPEGSPVRARVLEMVAPLLQRLQR